MQIETRLYRLGLAHLRDRPEELREAVVQRLTALESKRLASAEELVERAHLRSVYEDLCAPSRCASSTTDVGVV